MNPTVMNAYFESSTERALEIIQKKKLANILEYSNPNDLKSLKPRLYNTIILNLLKFLTLLTFGEESKDIITKNDFMKTILETISKPNILPKIVIQSLLALKNYFQKDFIPLMHCIKCNYNLCPPCAFSKLSFYEDENINLPTFKILDYVNFMDRHRDISNLQILKFKIPFIFFSWI